MAISESTTPRNGRVRPGGIEVDPNTGMPMRADGTNIYPNDPDWNPAWTQTLNEVQQAFQPGGKIYELYKNSPGLLGEMPTWMKIVGTAALTMGVASALGAFSAAADAGTLPEVASAAETEGAESALTSAAATDAATTTGLTGGALPAAALSYTEGGPLVDTIAPGLAETTSSTIPAGGSTLGTIGKALTTGSKIGDILGAAGQGIGAATTAAGNNALDQEKLALDANSQNISGQSAFINEALGLASEEDKQRKSALQDAYRASYAQNPRVSPFDPVGAPKLSSTYMDILSAMEGQAKNKLTSPAQYDTSKIPAPTPYTPIDIKNVQGATNTSPSTLQKIGQWVGPGLTIGSKIASLLGH